MRPSLLIIDEGINAIDAHLAGGVWRMLRRYATTNAVLLIAHDASILAQTDEIHVLEGGRIVESGPPAALVRSDGRFGRLWRERQGHGADLDEAPVRAAYRREAAAAR